jgi:hypothetical protein
MLGVDLRTFAHTRQALPQTSSSFKFISLRYFVTVVEIHYTSQSGFLLWAGWGDQLSREEDGELLSDMGVVRYQGKGESICSTN